MNRWPAAAAAGSLKGVMAEVVGSVTTASSRQLESSPPAWWRRDGGVWRDGSTIEVDGVREEEFRFPMANKQVWCDSTKAT